MGIDISTDDRGSDDSTFGIHEIGRGEGVEGKLVLEAVPGKDIGVSHTSVGNDAFGIADYALVINSGGIADNTDDSAALPGELGVEFFQFRHFVDAGTAEGSPDIYHSDLII